MHNFLISLFLLVAISGGLPPGGHAGDWKADFREKVLGELEKIREHSPRVKRQKAWMKGFREARAARQKALMESAEVFSKDEFEQGEELLNLSRAYAKKHEFRKAGYLARKAKETYDEAAKKAAKGRSLAVKKRKEEVEALEKKMKSMPKSGAGVVTRSLELKIIMLKDALRALDLVEFDRLKAEVEQKIQSPGPP